MYRTQRLELRMTPGDMALLDQLRGASTRSAYLRALLQREHTEQRRVTSGLVTRPDPGDPT